MSWHLYHQALQRDLGASAARVKALEGELVARGDRALGVTVTPEWFGTHSLRATFSLPSASARRPRAWFDGSCLVVRTPNPDASRHFDLRRAGGARRRRGAARQRGLHGRARGQGALAIECNVAP